MAGADQRGTAQVRDVPLSRPGQVSSAVEAPAASPISGGSSTSRTAAGQVARTVAEARHSAPSPVTTGDDLVIEGDNLDALRALLPTHRGTVRVVYIDPPYNTGNAHTYRDSFRTSASSSASSSDACPTEPASAGGPDPCCGPTHASAPSADPASGGARSPYRDHAAWLDFMRPRLELARALMREDGVLFLHIDDREQAFAQILGHEVFGEENSLGTLIHQRAKGGGQAKFVIRGHDYIHAWARSLDAAGPLVTEKKPPARYEVIDGRRMLVEDDVLRVSFGTYVRGRERRLMYEDIEAVRGPAKLAEIDRRLASGELALRPWGEPDPDTGERRHAVVRLTPAEQATSKLYSILRVMGSQGRSDLEELGLGGIFGYPKPVELVRTLVEAVTWHDPSAVVLDFFAGSGTTAQAVMEANARDGGARRFVLVQRAEPIASRLRAGRGTDTGRGTASAAAVPSASEAAPAFATISEFCAERVRRAAARWECSGSVRYLRAEDLSSGG
ncbi:site-specific DNA-methyltransferase [Brevibacterium salitolerans]|uniref:DNA methylase N-4/N-6 domain-containing protein n=1 Tax=Brevibacterium salitolerans TaxID=1403566 RepID=A0ABN2WU05_9MICO